MKLDKSSIWLIAKKEIALSMASKAVWGVLLLVFAGVIGLSAFMGNELEGEAASDYDALIFIFSTLIVTSLGLGIMMNATLVGGSITEEKDKKVVEILLSLVRAEELYIGKLVGHSIIGCLQLIFLWGAVLVSSVVFGVTTWADLPVGFAVASLVLLLQAYFFFTALYALMGALVSKVEDYSVAQIPILFFFLACMMLPFTPLIGWGSFEEGWLTTVAWISPLSMGIAPIVDALDSGIWIRTIVAAITFCVLIIFVNWVGMKLFKKKVLR